MITARTALLLLLLFCVSPLASARAQQRPLLTEDTETVPRGLIGVELGVDFLRNKNFPVSGLNGDLTRMGVIALTSGLSSDVELEIGGVIQNYLSINRQYRASSVRLDIPLATRSTYDAGDIYVATKVKLMRERTRLPSLGVRFGVELPVSHQARGIGVNQTNFFASGLAAKSFSQLRLYGNLGVGILTAPVEQFSQNDVVLYGLAASYSTGKRLTLTGELNGRYSSRSRAPLGTESDGAARLGVRFRFDRMMWDVSGIRGLHNDSAESGIVVGVGFDLTPFAGRP